MSITVAAIQSKPITDATIIGISREKLWKKIENRSIELSRKHLVIDS